MNWEEILEGGEGDGVAHLGKFPNFPNFSSGSEIFWDQDLSYSCFVVRGLRNQVLLSWMHRLMQASLIAASGSSKPPKLAKECVTATWRECDMPTWQCGNPCGSRSPFNSVKLIWQPPNNTIIGLHPNLYPYNISKKRQNHPTKRPSLNSLNTLLKRHVTCN